jgi:hypothetical protein
VTWQYSKDFDDIWSPTQVCMFCGWKIELESGERAGEFYRVCQNHNCRKIYIDSGKSFRQYQGIIMNMLNNTNLKKSKRSVNQRIKRKCDYMIQKYTHTLGIWSS